MFCPSIIAKTRKIVHMLFVLKAGNVFVFILGKKNNNQVLNWNSAGVGKHLESVILAHCGVKRQNSLFLLLYTWCD